MTKKQSQPQNILMEPLAERAARNVAAYLKRTGYTQATIEHCRHRSPIEIAAYFEPLDKSAQEKLTEEIAKVAELQP